MSATRGWKKAAPRRGEERMLMKAKCGNSCFLKPATLGFPICPYGKCSPSCKGLQSAYNRARQYRYPLVAARATILMKKKGCKSVQARVSAGGPLRGRLSRARRSRSRSPLSRARRSRSRSPLSRARRSRSRSPRARRSRSRSSRALRSRSMLAW